MLRTLTSCPNTLNMSGNVFNLWRDKSVWCCRRGTDTITGEAYLLVTVHLLWGLIWRWPSTSEIGDVGSWCIVTVFIPTSSHDTSLWWCRYQHTNVKTTASTKPLTVRQRIYLITVTKLLLVLNKKMSSMGGFFHQVAQVLFLFYIAHTLTVPGGTDCVSIMKGKKVIDKKCTVITIKNSL